MKIKKTDIVDVFRTWQTITIDKHDGSRLSHVPSTRYDSVAIEILQLIEDASSQSGKRK